MNRQMKIFINNSYFLELTLIGLFQTDVNESSSILERRYAFTFLTGKLIENFITAITFQGKKCCI